MAEVDKLQPLRNVLKEWDLMGFIKEGAPIDEYDMEADEITKRYKKEMTPQQVGELIYDIFVEYMEVDAPAVKEDCMNHGQEVKDVLDRII